MTDDQTREIREGLETIRKLVSEWNGFPDDGRCVRRVVQIADDLLGRLPVSLAPCPWCGQAVELHKTAVGFCVFCRTASCGARGPFRGFVRDAAIAWNAVVGARNAT